jgi:hypothetical protein
MAAGGTGSVAMARTRARRQQRAVRINGRMAAAAFLLFGEESESERGEDDEQSRPLVKALVPSIFYLEKYSL